MSVKNIKPCYWGKKYWGTIFSMIATYPENPDNETINSIKMYFISLRKLLCCQGCRESYTKFSYEMDTDINNNFNYISRNNVIKFVYKLREKVNKKLSMEYKITYEYFKYKLDKMICIDSNPVDGYVNDLAEVPFIQESIKNVIYDYLYKNKSYINNYDSKYTKRLTYKLEKFMKNPIFNLNNKNFKLFIKRTSECRTIISTIYNNISCGEYTMVESFYRDKEMHLKLFYMGCSIIPLYDLEYIFTAGTLHS